MNCHGHCYHIKDIRGRMALAKFILKPSAFLLLSSVEYPDNALEYACSCWNLKLLGGVIFYLIILNCVKSYSEKLELTYRMVIIFRGTVTKRLRLVFFALMKLYCDLSLNLACSWHFYLLSVNRTTCEASPKENSQVWCWFAGGVWRRGIWGKLIPIPVMMMLLCLFNTYSL